MEYHAESYKTPGDGLWEYDIVNTSAPRKPIAPHECYGCPMVKNVVPLQLAGHLAELQAQYSPMMDLCIPCSVLDINISLYWL